MSDFNMAALLNRMQGLEAKLKTMSVRLKKDIIWKKQLEDWILKTFNYDLRLQVELKLLQSEDGYGEDLGAPSPTVFQGQTSITRIVPSASNAISDIRASAQSQNCRISPKVSMSISTTVAQPPPGLMQERHDVPGLRAISPGNRGCRGGMSRRATGMGPGRVRHYDTTVRHPYPYANGAQRGLSMKRGRGRNVISSTPIIVSTKSMAQSQSQPQKSPELIVLDDDDEMKKEEQRTDNVRLSVSQPANPTSSSSVSVTTPGSSAVCIPSSSNAKRNYSPHFGGSGSNESNDCTLTSSSVQHIAESHHQTTEEENNSVLGLPTEHSRDPVDCLAALTNFTAAQLPSGMSNNPSQNLYTQAPSGGSLLPDLESQKSTFSMVQAEAAYAENKFLTRIEGELMFNVPRIVEHYDPILQTDLLHQSNGGAEISVPLGKRLASSLCDFLVTVYGEQVPREAEEAMADSLVALYPYISKDIWYKKEPNKTATGLIHSRITTIRKERREQLRRFDLDNIASHLGI